MFTIQKYKNCTQSKQIKQPVHGIISNNKCITKMRALKPSSNRFIFRIKNLEHMNKLLHQRSLNTFLACTMKISSRTKIVRTVQNATLKLGWSCNEDRNGWHEREFRSFSFIVTKSIQSRLLLQKCLLCGSERYLEIDYQCGVRKNASIPCNAKITQSVDRQW